MSLFDLFTYQLHPIKLKMVMVELGVNKINLGSKTEVRQVSNLGLYNIRWANTGRKTYNWNYP